MDAVPALLETVELSVSFGGIKALDGLDLRVPEGRLVGLIGPNGAGKTTTIDALTGFVGARGSVRFAGEDITDWSVHDRARAGLVQGRQELIALGFCDLTTGLEGFEFEFQGHHVPQRTIWMTPARTRLDPSWGNPGNTFMRWLPM